MLLPGRVWPRNWAGLVAVLVGLASFGQQATGQKPAGGWSYQCPSAVGAHETRRLTGSRQKRNELKGGREMPKKKKFEEGVDRELPKEIQDQLRKIVPPKAAAQQPMGRPGIPAE